MNDHQINNKFPTVNPETGLWIVKPKNLDSDLVPKAGLMLPINPKTQNFTLTLSHKVKLVMSKSEVLNMLKM